MNMLKPTPVLKLDTRISRSQSRSARSCVAQARVTEEEHRVLLTAASLDGKALGEWAREILLREARRSADDPLFTELIATRMILLNLLKPLAMGQVVTPEDFTRISATVRSDKRKVAQEIQQQYTKATHEGVVIMATQWGRKETIIWPPHVPMLSYTAVATALLCTCLFIWQRFTSSLEPLQKSYITEYIRSEAGGLSTHMSPIGCSIWEAEEESLA